MTTIMDVNLENVKEKREKMDRENDARKDTSWKKWED